MRDIEKDQHRCMNTFTKPMILMGRESQQPLPNQDRMLNTKKMKDAGKPKITKEKDIFIFPNQSVKKIKKKPIPSKKEKDLFDCNECMGNQKKPKLNKNY